ncbi:MAG TPA: TIGR03067 domain-containing protein [Isosphaeraceae bacterium]|nr:TIGR03067 domain-containing protein [Isosphaeraceae bacterium]
MRAKYSLLTLVAVAASLAWISAVAGTETLANNSDMSRLQGRWTARAGARREIRVTLDIQGRRVDAAITTPQGVRLQVRGELKLDEASSPHSLDWIKFTGADQQEFPPIPAIYKIDRDTFTVCNGGLNGSRPREFKAGDSVLEDVVVFQRIGTASQDKPKAPNRSTNLTPEAKPPQTAPVPPPSRLARQP